MSVHLNFAAKCNYFFIKWIIELWLFVRTQQYIHDCCSLVMKVVSFLLFPLFFGCRVYSVCVPNPVTADGGAQHGGSRHLHGAVPPPPGPGPVGAPRQHPPTRASHPGLHHPGSQSDWSWEAGVLVGYYCSCLDPFLALFLTTVIVSLWC